MHDSHETLNLYRVNSIISDYNSYKNRPNQRKKKKKKEYSKIMKEVAEELKKSSDNGVINVKI